MPRCVRFPADTVAFTGLRGDSDSMPGLRILHVDDNPGDANLLSEAVSEAGVSATIETAPNGVRAIEYLHQCASHPGHALPDLILLDLNMPVMNGLTLLRIISRHDDWRRVPVAVLSSSQLNAEQEEAFALGAIAYLIKPHDFVGYLTLARQLPHFPKLEGSVRAAAAVAR